MQLQDTAKFTNIYWVVMSWAIERPVNQQSTHSWLLNRLCLQWLSPGTDVALLEQLCSAAPLPAQETLPACSSSIPASQNLCAPSPVCCGCCHALCVLRGCASTHPETELQSGTRALSVSQQACFAFSDTWGVTD